MTDATLDGTETLFRRLLAAAGDVHAASPGLCNFADWPTDLAYVAPHPRSIPVLPRIRAMADEGALQAALAAVVDHADWIQTYSEAEVGRHFLDNYGYIELFGPTGIFTSTQCRAFIGYWGQGLYYPIHDHEAEEAYLVISGRCLFEAEGAEPADLGVGGVRIHASYQKHAMQMRDAPMLALCLWRGAGMADRAHLTHDTADLAHT